MLKLADPVLVSVRVRVLVEPVLTLPKLMLTGLALSLPCAWEALPERGTFNGELEASLVMARLPEKLAADVGAKVTVTETLAPGDTVVPVRPEELKPVPLAAACEICTVPAPLLVNVTVCGLVLPTFTVPKETLVGLACSCPTGGACPDPTNSNAPMS